MRYYQKIKFIVFLKRLNNLIMNDYSAMAVKELIMGPAPIVSGDRLAAHAWQRPEEQRPGMLHGPTLIFLPAFSRAPML